MKSIGNHVIELLGSLIVLILVAGAPVSIIWGWVRWAKDSSRSTFWSKLSFVGFLLANLSICIYIGGVVYAQVIGGFPYYDPRLMRMMRVGACVSLIGIVISLLGCWRPGKLRWLAPAATLGSLLCWFFTAMGE
jgi:hypothetical protein